MEDYIDHTYLPNPDTLNSDNNKSLTLSEYQREAYKTFLSETPDPFHYMVFGLVSEIGEFVGKVKKLQRDHHIIFPIDFPPTIKEELFFELGDILWYIAGLSTQLHIDLGEVGEKNLQKLSDRKKRDAIKGSGDYR